MAAVVLVIAEMNSGTFYLIAQSEGKKQEEINIAEGKMTASIRESEGSKQAAINNAQGEAEALLLVANATAESIKVMASAIQSEGGLTAVNLKVAERFVDAFGNIAKQGNTMILPGNAADFAGMVATAMQVVKRADYGQASRRNKQGCCTGARLTRELQ